jgi:hypothetical protein
MLGAMFLAFQIASYASKKANPSRIHAVICLAAIVVLVSLAGACGGGGGGSGGGNPGQTFTISIQGVSQNFQHLTSALLVVD